MKRSPEWFLSGFEWSEPFQWRGRQAFRQLGNGRFARLTLTDWHTGGGMTTSAHYRSIDVEIVDPDVGRVDRQLFCFDDYLHDIDRSHPNADHEKSLRVISYVQWDWYILRPRSTRPLCEAIEEYLAIFTPTPSDRTEPQP